MSDDAAHRPDEPDRAARALSSRTPSNHDSRPRSNSQSSHRPEPKHWSGLPLAASLALVAFAVLFGIYGPKVVDRSNPPIGIPVGELANATADRHLERVQQLSGSAEKPLELAEAEASAATILGEPVTLPDLSGLGFAPFESKPATVPGGGRAVLVTYGRTKAVKPSFLSLLLVPDREQYVVYSPFGKPTILPSWDFYPVETADEGFGHSQALVWTDGAVVRVLHSADRSALEESRLRVIESSRGTPRRSGRADEEAANDSHERAPDGR